MRVSSLASVLENYEVLMALWEDAKDIAYARNRIAGVQYQINSFDYLFGVSVGECILKHTDNLSKTLQNPKLTANDAHTIADLTHKTLERLRNDKTFDMFWERVILRQTKLGLNEPTLPRKRHAPARYEVGSGSSHFHESPLVYYRTKYYEALDLVMRFISQRFNQPGYAIYFSLQKLLVKAVNREEFSSELEAVVRFYGDDFEKATFEVHLELLGACFVQFETFPVSFSDIVSHMKSLTPAVRCSMSQAFKVLQLILVLPATNAVSERRAFALRRVKNYLRTTMGQKRLNNLMTLHVHKGRSDQLDLRVCVNECVECNDHREQRIAKFSLS